MKNLIYIAIGGGIAYYLYQRNQKNKKGIAKAPSTNTEPVSVNEGNTKTESNAVSNDKKSVADLFLKVQKKSGSMSDPKEDKLIYKYFDSLSPEDLKDWAKVLRSEAFAAYSKVTAQIDVTAKEKDIFLKKLAKEVDIEISRFEGLMKNMGLYIQKLVLQDMKEAGFDTENVKITPYDDKSSFNGQRFEVNELIDL